MNEQVLAGTSATATVTSFVATANTWLQLAALVIAIVSGLMAIRAHFRSAK
jgi:hypothetical protein